MKNLFLITFISISNIFFTQNTCFNKNKDVIEYVNGKTFINEQWNIQFEFDSTKNVEIFQNGKIVNTFFVDSFFYLGDGHKAELLLKDKSGREKVARISCKEKVLSFNDGWAYIEKGSNSDLLYINVIGETIKIGGLEIMKNDLGKFDFETANKICSDLGNGWHLPTKAELNILHKYKGKIGGFILNQSYWSSSRSSNGSAPWSQFFGTDHTDGNTYNGGSTATLRGVRAVRKL